MSPSTSREWHILRHVTRNWVVYFQCWRETSLETLSSVWRCFPLVYFKQINERWVTFRSISFHTILTCAILLRCHCSNQIGTLFLRVSLVDQKLKCFEEMLGSFVKVYVPEQNRIAAVTETMLCCFFANSKSRHIKHSDVQSFFLNARKDTAGYNTQHPPLRKLNLARLTRKALEIIIGELKHEHMVSSRVYKCLLWKVASFRRSLWCVYDDR